jgi:muramidase (phage lysozyme)
MMRALLAAGAVVGLAALAARPSQAATFDPAAGDASSPAWGIPADESDQTNNAFEDAWQTMNPTNLFAPAVPADVAARNVRAFLDALASDQFEGTARYGDNGYNVMFGGRLFDSYADHPRQYFPFTDRAGNTRRTSAAGRYQFIVPTWDSLAARLQLPDFGPDSQDAAAVELIREKGALADVQAGRLAMATAKVATIWASLPGAGANQHEGPYQSLVAAFQAGGGLLTA